MQTANGNNSCLVCNYIWDPDFEGHNCPVCTEVPAEPLEDSWHCSRDDYMKSHREATGYTGVGGWGGIDDRD